MVIPRMLTIGVMFAINENQIDIRNLHDNFKKNFFAAVFTNKKNVHD